MQSTIYTSILFVLNLQAVYQLPVWLQSMSVLFIASCHSQGDLWQYPPLKGPCSKDFIVHYMGPVNCPFYFYPIFLFYLLQILACFLLFLLHLFLRLFPKFFFLLFFLSSIISNFFPFSPSILYQISCHSIYITFLLYIFPAVLLYSLLCYSFFFYLLDTSSIFFFKFIH